MSRITLKELSDRLDLVTFSRLGGVSVAIDDSLLIGGWRVVADIPARDAIPMSRRKEGMYVNVVSEFKTYSLIGGVDNAYWQEVPLPA